MSFRDNLQHLRATRNMTQEQLAMLLGVSRQSVTKWEAEKAYPEMDKLLKLCQIFECSLDDLVTGDLTAYQPQVGQGTSAPVFSGPPADICGYDEHMTTFAKRISLGVALIILGVAGCVLVPSLLSYAMGTGAVERYEILGVAVLFAGIVAGLAFLVPGGMDHAAFMKAHPYVEDFYTDADRADASRQLAIAVVAAVGIVLAAVLFPILGDGTRWEGAAAGVLLVLIAAAVYLLIRFGMMFARVDVAEYNKDVASELDYDEIDAAPVTEEQREALRRMRRQHGKVGAICGAIMMLATIVALVWLFCGPMLFDARATAGYGHIASMFWIPWPVGGILCGIVSVLMQAFGKDEREAAVNALANASAREAATPKKLEPEEQGQEPQE